MKLVEGALAGNPKDRDLLFSLLNRHEAASRESDEALPISKDDSALINDFLRRAKRPKDS